MYRKKGVQMLDKPEQIFSDTQQPKMKPQQFTIYQAMQNELIQKGYSDFRFVAQGEQGLVLLAKNSKTNIRYAIKGIQVRDLLGKVDDDLLNQVKQEINILTKCRDSPYVVSLLETFEGKQFSYLVLTECQGTLKEIQEKNQNKRLNEISAIKYAKDIAQGLYYIHSKSCIVNDLKMDNILIDYNGNAVVSDFGLADNLTSKSSYAMSQYVYIHLGEKKNKQTPKNQVKKVKDSKIKQNKNNNKNQKSNGIKWLVQYRFNKVVVGSQLQPSLIKRTIKLNCKLQNCMQPNRQYPRMGNFLYQAPECYDPQSDAGKVYFDEYQQLGVNVKNEPSNRSEACSLGYLIYTMVQGIHFQLALNKHKKLNYDKEFNNFVYSKHLQQLIDGLTNFVPRNRLPIKEALIILKGIISFEFQLDEMLIEMIDQNTQQFASSLKNDIEFVQNFSNKFYPIIKNEQNLLQNLNSIAIDSKQSEQEKLIEGLYQEIKNLNETKSYLENEIKQLQNCLKNNQPFVQINQDYSNQVYNQTVQPNLSQKDNSFKQVSQKKDEIPNKELSKEQSSMEYISSKEQSSMEQSSKEQSSMEYMEYIRRKELSKEQSSISQKVSLINGKEINNNSKQNRWDGKLNEDENFKRCTLF